MKATANARRDLTAYHEAGHAVAYIAHRLTFETVDILQSGDRLGFISRIWRHVPIGMWDQGAVEGALAGPIAQRMHSGQWDWPGASSDLDYVIEAQDQLDAYFRDLWKPEYGGSSYGHWRDISMDRTILGAAALLASYWPSVRRVARALVKRGELAYGEAEELVSFEDERGARPPLSMRSLRAVRRQMLYRRMA